MREDPFEELGLGCLCGLRFKVETGNEKDPSLYMEHHGIPWGLWKQAFLLSHGVRRQSND